MLVVTDQVSSQLGQILHLLLTDVASHQFSFLSSLNESAVIILSVFPQESLGGEEFLTFLAGILSGGSLAGVKVER